MTRSRRFILTAIITLIFGYSLPAQSPPKKDSAVADPEISVTRHFIKIDGKQINYTATAGTLALKNDKDETVALFGFTAYIKEGETETGKRPVTFAYNGGPGSSSMWLHMGALGPKIVVTNDPGLTPPAPYKTIDNEYSILDVTDLVLIDPVGTGLSRPTGKSTGKDFWGVDQDIKSVSQFIRQYVTENDRWNSPKYLLGESYGTTRSAGVADYLFEKMGMQINGVILVSSVLDFHTLGFREDLSFEVFLPTFAAVAWYHNKIPHASGGLDPFLKEVRIFSAGEYATALQKGDQLTDAEKDQIAKKLSEYSGLSKDYWIKANLRVYPSRFREELLRNEHQIVGRIDARYKGINPDIQDEGTSEDPQSDQVSPPFVSSFLNYYYTDLKVNRKYQYAINSYGAEGFKWDWGRSKNGNDAGLFVPNTGEDLANLMAKDPQLRILVLNGYYDLATAFFATEFSFDHLNLDKTVKKNVMMKYFESGHMMYTDPASLILFKQYIAAFIQAPSGNEPNHTKK